MIFVDVKKKYVYDIDSIHKTAKEGVKMAVSKVGTLIKEARTKAGLTQEQLARKIKGVSADDISKAERGEKDFTQTVLKEIAKATGVTQKSLIDAAKGSSQTAAAKKTTAAKKTSSSELKLSTEEKKILKAYRSADEKIQLTVKTLLLGPGAISASSASSAFSSLLEGVQSLMGSK